MNQLQQYIGVAIMCTGLGGMHSWGAWAPIGAGLFVFGLFTLGDARWDKR